MLAQWKHYKEDRSECINLFDSRLGTKNISLLRLHVLLYLVSCAAREVSLEVPVKECVTIFCETGASTSHILSVLKFLQKRSLIRSTTAEEVSIEGRIVASKSGGYYAKILSHRMVYVESCMLDTAIADSETWASLYDLTISIEKESSKVHRMEQRGERLTVFLQYLEDIENNSLQNLSTLSHIACISTIKDDVMKDVKIAISKTSRYGN